jgi:hypothetical protein
MALVKASGSTWVRFDVAAVQVESAPSVRNWSNIDRIVSSALVHGLEPLGIVTTLPRWAAASWDVGPTTATQRAAFAEFSRSAAARYVGRVTYWEVWNEPNNQTFWRNPAVGDYVSLLKSASPAIKAGNPGAKVLMGGTAGGQLAPNDTESWFGGMYANGAQAYFDFANMHPYPDGGNPVVASSGEMSHIAAIRATMTSYGDGAKIMFGTESGFPTAAANSTSLQGQATLLGGLFSFWHSATWGQQGPLFVYTLRDLPDAVDREAWFGIIRSDFSAKPAFAALVSINAAVTTG